MFQISPQTLHLIRLAVREDIGSGDLTTRLLIPPQAKAKAFISVKQDGILCGGPVVKTVFQILDRSLKITERFREGSYVRAGARVLEIRGRAASILKGERTALNFLGRLSGIAALTRQFVDEVKGTHAHIFDTRKTTPLWRELEKYAVRCGGGRNHRMGLWDQVLVKDNHLSVIEKTTIRKDRHREEPRRGDVAISSPEIATPPAGARNDGQAEMLAAILRRAKKRCFVEIEASNLRELKAILPLKPNAILLDNFSLRDLKRAVQIAKAFKPAPILEASGGVTLLNVRAVAETGVDRISVGALTHSAPALDVSLKVIFGGRRGGVRS